MSQHVLLMTLISNLDNYTCFEKRTPFQKHSTLFHRKKYFHDVQRCSAKSIVLGDSTVKGVVELYQL
jgi:hypothetical protein